MINRVVLVGRMVRDPELKATPSGSSVVNFTLAIDNRRGSNGEKTTSFIPCVVWGASAENTKKYTHKGSLVGVEGRLNQRTYDSKDGRKVTVIEVFCDSVQFLEPKTSTNSGRTPAYVPDAVPSDVEEMNVSSISVTDDNLPF